MPLSPGSLPDELEPARAASDRPGRPSRSRSCRRGAAVRGLLGRLDRLRAGVARAVGEQHDDRRRVGALRDRRRRACRCGSSSARLGATLVVDLGDGVDRLEDRAADRGPATGRQALRRRRAAPPGRSSAPGRSRRSRRTRRCRSGSSRPGARRTRPPPPRPPPAGWAGCRSRTCCATRPSPGRRSSGRSGPATIATGRAIATTRLAEPEQEQRERQVAPDPRRPRRCGAHERQAREAHAGASAPQDQTRTPTSSGSSASRTQDAGPQEVIRRMPSRATSQRGQRATDEQEHEPERPRTARSARSARVGRRDASRCRRRSRSRSRRVGGRVVGAAGHVGDALERRLVELGVDLEALDLERRPLRRCRCRRCRCGRRGRLRPAAASSGSGRLVVLAVGQQHDDRRLVRARPGRASGRGVGSGERFV